MISKANMAWRGGQDLNLRAGDTYQLLSGESLSATQPPPHKMGNQLHRQFLESFSAFVQNATQLRISVSGTSSRGLCGVLVPQLGLEPRTSPYEGDILASKTIAAYITTGFNPVAKSKHHSCYTLLRGTSG